MRVHGICQIEDLIRARHIDTAEIALELTASGLAPLVDASQISRLRQLAGALGTNKSFLNEHPLSRNIAAMSKDELHDERKMIAARLEHLQAMMMDLPWANWQPIYDQIGSRYDEVKAELSRRP